ncbi:DUF4236 domain-containing protein [Halomonas saccharevitans]|uniref:DUF4236 domain-containing protein n=1 Tax=Halomonas saccharevitans TaxID=416872 RepID=A0A1I7A6W8_9GAMM|nr:DUF4236 domain-containing protein [Halomonas saccharevitans]MDT8877910.1 DUF4236 domain-containing protein [Halomonas saccharevitans]SFT70683.1 hypothetical protein SAMN04487956_11567 [Halomonas saccharevitans]
MEFRFQRRIRLAPGVRFHTTRLRPGLSLGPPGISLLIAGGEADEPLPVDLEITASGEVRYRQADGTRMTAAGAREVRRRAEAELREALGAHCEDLNAQLERLGRLHEQTPAPDATGYRPRSYPESPPVPVAETRPAWWQGLWAPARRRHDRENARRQAEHAQAYRAWEWRKAEFDAREFQRQRREDEASWDDPDAMQQTLVERLEELDWPRETLIDFALVDDYRTIALDIDLPGPEEMPDRRWSMPAKRIKLSPQRLTVTRQRQLYRDYLHGVAFRVLGAAFARLPRIELALVSGYRRLDDPAADGGGRRYLFSVKVSREQWQGLAFDELASLDPGEVLADFSLRREMTRGGELCDITPFEPDWRWR